MDWNVEVVQRQTNFNKYHILAYRVAVAVRSGSGSAATFFGRGAVAVARYFFWRVAVAVARS